VVGDAAPVGDVAGTRAPKATSVTGFPWPRMSVMKESIKVSGDVPFRHVRENISPAAR
jgi:hypothetical protein